MKRTYIIFSLFLISKIGFTQQQPIYAQYMFNMLNVNPAYAGSRDVGNLNVLLRKQWLGIDGGPTTGSISYDQRIQDRNFSIGGQLYYDKLYIQNRTGLQGFYSYMAGMEKSTLSIGMSFGVLNYNTNYTRTNPFQSGDPGQQEIVNSFLPTAGFGVLWSGEKWFLAASTPNLFKAYKSELNSKSVSFAGKEANFYLTGGYSFDLSDQLIARPSVMLKSISGAPIQIDFNMNFWLANKIGLGASYRTGDAIVGMAQLQVSSLFRVGYAYEQKIKIFNTSSHELMIRYEFGGLIGKGAVSPINY
jgi:type IX secretion system PorP/SprF family membrane protein